MKSIQSSSAYKPTPVHLKELGPYIQMAASEMQWSSQHLLRNIVAEWLDRKHSKPAGHFKKMMDKKKVA